MGNAPIQLVPIYSKKPKKRMMKAKQDSKRSLLVFESAIRSEYTKRNYRCTLDRFMKFVKIDDHDKLARIPDLKLQKMLEDYIMFLKTQNLNPNSFPIMLTGLELFYSMNDRVINWKKIKKLFPQTIKKSGYRAYDTKQIQILLKSVTDLRNRAIILFLASTGVRIGAMEGLTMKHVKDMPGGCKKVIIYENTKEEYIVFLTPEASAALENSLQKRRNDGEIITSESPLFRDKYQRVTNPAKPLNYRGYRDLVKRVVRKTGLGRERIGTRYDIQLCHGFRKRFNTILKTNREINSNMAEKLMGHKNGLDGVYFVPNEEQLFEEFRKSIKELTIDDSEKDKMKIKELESEKQELEKKEKDIEVLKHNDLLKEDAIRALSDQVIHLTNALHELKMEKESTCM